ncbi:MAG: hypothetical protein ACOY0T_36235 [Myxococcota bacterium]
MNKHTKFGWIGWAFVLGLAMGCWDDDPCDPDQVFVDGVCRAAPAGGAGMSSTGGQSSVGGAGGNANGDGDSTWGKACAMPTDCTGDSPICAPSPLGYCTNINCSAGEANADICPVGWMCFPAGNGNPSACVRL